MIIQKTMTWLFCIDIGTAILDSEKMLNFIKAKNFLQREYSF